MSPIPSYYILYIIIVGYIDEELHRNHSKKCGIMLTGPLDYPNIVLFASTLPLSTARFQLLRPAHYVPCSLLFRLPQQ